MAFGDVQVDLFYLKRLDLYKHEKPFEIYMDIPVDSPDQRTKNTEFEPGEQTIHDIRGREEEYEIDVNGFMIRKLTASLDAQNGYQKAQVESQYLPEVERFLRAEISDIDHIYFFDWRVCFDLLEHALVKITNGE